MRNILVGASLSASFILPGYAEEPATADHRAEISGRVVDAATGQPIEGAVVWATWYAEVSPNPAKVVFGLVVGGHGGSEQRVVQVKEALADSDGRFVIPSWSAGDQLRGGSITSASPFIGFFKPGYDPAGLNRYSWETGRSDVEPGINGHPKEMALYRYGKKPKEVSGVVDPSVKRPAAEEAILQSVAGLRSSLDENIFWADDRDAPPDSRARQTVRRTQQRATEMIERELQRLQSEYSGKKEQQGKDKQ